MNSNANPNDRPDGKNDQKFTFAGFGTHHDIIHADDDKNDQEFAFAGIGTNHDIINIGKNSPDGKNDQEFTFAGIGANHDIIHDDDDDAYDDDDVDEDMTIRQEAPSVTELLKPCSDDEESESATESAQNLALDDTADMDVCPDNSKDPDDSFGPPGNSAIDTQTGIAESDDFNDKNDTTNSVDKGSTQKGLAPAEKHVSRDKLPIGYVLKNQYRIDGIIGSGGFGVVYSAVDLNDNTRVAIKTLRHNTLEEYDVAISRFKREIELCKSLSNPHIIKILDHGSMNPEGYPSPEDAIFYYVMEYLKGKTLDEYILNREKFTFNDVRSIMLQVLDGLACAHKEKIIHRDMKPANIFLIEKSSEIHDFDVKILDFGIAKTLDSKDAQKLTQTGAWMGSPAYMSPEQLKGCELTTASDIFAIGLIMVEMLTGIPTVDGDSPMDIAMKIMDPTPVYVDDWIMASSIAPSIVKCLEKNPLGRFINAQSLRLELQFLNPDTLKNEYTSLKLQKRLRPSTMSMPPAPVSTPSIPSYLVEQPTLSMQESINKKQFGLHIILIIAIIGAVIAIGTILFVKLYVDKATGDQTVEAPADAMAKMSPAEKTFVRGAMRGAVIGSLNLRRIRVAISSMPPGADIYRASDNKLIGSTPTTIRLIPSTTPWNVIVKAEGYNDYPLIINAIGYSSIPLTMTPKKEANPRQNAKQDNDAENGQNAAQIEEMQKILEQQNEIQRQKEEIERLQAQQAAEEMQRREKEAAEKKEQDKHKYNPKPTKPRHHAGKSNKKTKKEDKKPKRPSWRVDDIL